MRLPCQGALSLLDWPIASDALAFFRQVIAHETNATTRARAVSAVFDLVLVYGVRRVADAHGALDAASTDADTAIKLWAAGFLRLQTLQITRR